MFARVSELFFLSLFLSHNGIVCKSNRLQFLCPFFTKGRFREGMIVGYKKRSFVHNQSGYNSA